MHGGWVGGGPKHTRAFGGGGSKGIFLTLWATDMKAEFTGWEHTVKIDLAGGEQITIPGEENIFALEDRAFVDSVKAGKNVGILATYEDGLKATVIACAANESMETGEGVDVKRHVWSS